MRLQPSVFKSLYHTNCLNHDSILILPVVKVVFYIDYIGIIIITNLILHVSVFSGVRVITAL